MRRHQWTADEIDQLVADGHEVWDYPLPKEAPEAFLAFVRYRELRSYRQVAAGLGVPLHRIRYLARRYAWRARIDAYYRYKAERSMEAFYEGLRSSAHKALATLYQGMADESAPLRDRRQCAVDILRMLGLYNETTRITVTNTAPNSFSQLLEEIKSRAQLYACDGERLADTPADPDME